MIDFDKTVQTIPNLLTANHAHIVYGLIRWLRPSKVVEIGAYMGFTTCYIAKALKDNGININTALYVIDNFSLHGVTPAQIANALHFTGVNEVPTFILPLNSQTMREWPSMDMAIIDGDHSYEGCFNDFANCVSQGAYIVVIHDTVEWWGPRQFVEELTQAQISKDGFPEIMHGWTILEGYHDSGLTICIRSIDKPECRYKKGADVNEATQ